MRPLPLPSTLAVVLTLAACGTTSHANLVPQPLAGAPERFLGPGAAVEPAGAACRSPLRSPDGAVVLTLVRSGREPGRPELGWGDYSVAPSGSYGLQPNQLVRVACGSARTLGTVPRE